MKKRNQKNGLNITNKGNYISSKDYYNILAYGGITTDPNLMFSLNNINNTVSNNNNKLDPILDNSINNADYYTKKVAELNPYTHTVSDSNTNKTYSSSVDANAIGKTVGSVGTAVGSLFGPIGSLIGTAAGVVAGLGAKAFNSGAKLNDSKINSYDNTINKGINLNTNNLESLNDSFSDYNKLNRTSFNQLGGNNLSIKDNWKTYAGMMLAPGSLIGEANFVGKLFNRKNAYKQRDRINKQVDAYNTNLSNIYNTNAQTLTENKNIMDAANVSAYGGGININSNKKGTFTAAASKHNKSVQEFARQVLANKDNYSTAMVKKANFARNAANWHAYGGELWNNDTQYGDANIYKEGGTVNTGNNRDNLTYIAAKLKSYGYNDNMIKGIITNIKAENNGKSGPHGNGAYGLVGWRGSRFNELKKFAKQRGTSWEDLDTQIDFIHTELNSSENKALKYLAASGNAKEAAYNFAKYYERPGEAEAKRRGGINYVPTGVNNYLNNIKQQELYAKSLDQQEPQQDNNQQQAIDAAIQSLQLQQQYQQDNYQDITEEPQNDEQNNTQQSSQLLPQSAFNIPINQSAYGGEIFSYGGNLFPNGGPISKKLFKIAEQVNKSNARFVARLKDPKRQVIADWENPNQIATHKLGYFENNGKTYIYPNVQSNGIYLIDYTNPIYDPKLAIDNAIEQNDTVEVNSPEDAELFTTQYKSIYPRFDKYAQGGQLNYQHGGEYNDGIEIFNGGGTHEQNPYGGIQQGVDQNGKPNLVEEGEVKFNNYIFSNRLGLDKKLLDQVKLPKKYANYSFAKAAEDIQKEYAEKPTDPISARGTNANLEKLKAAQEALKQMQAQQEAMKQQQAMQEQQAMQQQYDDSQVPEEEEYAYGGNLFPDGGTVQKALYANVPTYTNAFTYHKPGQFVPQKNPNKVKKSLPDEMKVRDSKGVVYNYKNIKGTSKYYNEHEPNRITSYYTNPKYDYGDPKYVETVSRRQQELRQRKLDNTNFYDKGIENFHDTPFGQIWIDIGDDYKARVYKDPYNHPIARAAFAGVENTPGETPSERLLNFYKTGLPTGPIFNVASKLYHGEKTDGWDWTGAGLDAFMLTNWATKGLAAKKALQAVEGSAKGIAKGTVKGINKIKRNNLEKDFAEEWFKKSNMEVWNKGSRSGVRPRKIDEETKSFLTQLASKNKYILRSDNSPVLGNYLNSNNETRLKYFGNKLNALEQKASKIKKTEKAVNKVSQTFNPNTRLYKFVDKNGNSKEIPYDELNPFQKIRAANDKSITAEGIRIDETLPKILNSTRKLFTNPGRKGIAARMFLEYPTAKYIEAPFKSLSSTAPAKTPPGGFGTPINNNNNNINPADTNAATSTPLVPDSTATSPYGTSITDTTQTQTQPERKVTSKKVNNKKVKDPNAWMNTLSPEDRQQFENAAKEYHMESYGGFLHNNYFPDGGDIVYGQDSLNYNNNFKQFKEIYDPKSNYMLNRQYILDHWDTKYVQDWIRDVYIPYVTKINSSRGYKGKFTVNKDQYAKGTYDNQYGAMHMGNNLFNLPPVSDFPAGPMSKPEDADNAFIGPQQPQEWIDYVNNQKSTSKPLSTWERYVPAAGGLFGYLDTISRGKNYKNADIIANTNIPSRRIHYNPINEYVQYMPIDNTYEANQANNQATATRQSLIDLYNGNRGAAAVALANLNYATTVGAGDMYNKATTNNFERLLNAQNFNRATNQANSSGFLEADKTNLQAGLSSDELRLKAALANAEMRQNIDNAYETEKGANLTNFFNSLGNIGLENFNANQVNSNQAYNYYTAVNNGLLTGEAGYKRPNYYNNTKAEGGELDLINKLYKEIFEH